MDASTLELTPAWLAAAAMPWAIPRRWYELILAIAARSHDAPAGREYAAAERRRRGLDGPRPPRALAFEPGEKIEGTRYAYRRGNVAVVRMLGPIFHRANLFTNYSGAVANELMARDVHRLAGDRKVKGILIEMDSPGGTVGGTDELAQVIYKARAEKPIATYASYYMASGGYYLGTAATEVWANPASSIGSIGVVQVAPESYRGKGEVVIVSSKAPLKWKDAGTEAGREAIQEELDALHELFAAAVAKHMGVARRKVDKEFGRGGTMAGPAAAEAGMVDGLSTFEDVLKRLQSGRVRARPGRGRPRGAAASAREGTMAKRSLGDRLVGWLGRQPEIAGGDVPIALPAPAPATPAAAPAQPAAEDPVVAELKKQVGALSTQLGTMTELANKAEARRVEEAVAARARAWAARVVGPGVAKALPAEQADLEAAHARAQRDDLDRPVEAGQKTRVQLLEASVDARQPHALFGRRLGAVPLNPAAPNQAGIGLVDPDPKAPDPLAEARAANDRWAAQAGLAPKAQANGHAPASA